MNSVKPSPPLSPSETPKKRKSRKFRPFSYFFYDFAYATGALSALIWLRPKLHYPFGKPNKKGPLLVLANHNTIIDPIIVQVAFPFRRLHSIATKDLFDTPIKNFVFTQMHCIKIDKDNFSLSSLHEILEKLDEEKLVLIFPEGKIQLQNSSDLSAFKSGVVLMAHKSGAPVIPIYIPPRKKWYHRQHIIIGQAVNIKEQLGRIPTMTAISATGEALREKEMELRSYYENLSGKE